MAGHRKHYHDSKILIGTISKIGTGFDEQSACIDFSGERINMLILMGTTKSDTVVEQVLGRAFRADLPHIIIFVDNVQVVKRHWYVIKKWCLEHNGEIHDIKSQTVKDEHNGQEHINNLAAAQLSYLNLKKND
jgi:hypothetical protein